MYSVSWLLLALRWIFLGLFLFGNMIPLWILLDIYFSFLVPSGFGHSAVNSIIYLSK